MHGVLDETREGISKMSINNRYSTTTHGVYYIGYYIPKMSITYMCDCTSKNRHISLLLIIYKTLVIYKMLIYTPLKLYVDQ